MTLTRYRETPTARPVDTGAVDTVWRRGLAHPALGATTGAIVIAFSAILVRLIGISPEATAFFRCALALPPLAFVARWERKRFGPRSHRARAAAFGAGAFLGVDLVVWHYTIDAVGAGLSTVLANLQVVIVGVLAWLLFNERLQGRLLIAIPTSLSGVVLISGVLEENAFGKNPVRGVILGVVTSLAYTGFLLLLRRGGRNVKSLAGPLFDASLAAAVVAGALALIAGAFEVPRGWEATTYLVLLALGPQVVGWLLISLSLTKLPTAVTSLLLLVQSVAAVALAVILLGEAPSPFQLVGVTLVLTGVFTGALGSGSAQQAT